MFFFSHSRVDESPLFSYHNMLVQPKEDYLSAAAVNQPHLSNLKVVLLFASLSLVDATKKFDVLKKTSHHLIEHECMELTLDYINLDCLISSRKKYFMRRSINSRY